MQRPRTDSPKSGERTAPDADVRDTLDALRRIVQALRLNSRDVEQTTGLTGPQLFALQLIAEHPGASINDLAALTFTHQSSVSVVVQRLVDQALVKKVAARDDRRRQHLELTKAGRRSGSSVPAVAQQRLIEAVVSLSPRDRGTLARLLNEVARQLVPATEKHPPMLFEERFQTSGGPARRRRQPVPKG